MLAALWTIWENKKQTVFHHEKIYCWSFQTLMKRPLLMKESIVSSFNTTTTRPSFATTSSHLSGSNFFFIRPDVLVLVAVCHRLKYIFVSTPGSVWDSWNSYNILHRAGPTKYRTWRFCLAVNARAWPGYPHDFAALGYRNITIIYHQFKQLFTSTETSFNIFRFQHVWH